MDGNISRFKNVLRTEKDDRVEVGNQIKEYTSLFDKEGAETRKQNYTDVVNKYYDLATDFYEFGWGHCFHFAPRHKWETLNASIERHELWLANRMNLRPNMKVIDIGCGVGGPLRNIAKFSGAHITGLNNNAYQVSRAEKMAKESGLEGKADYIKGDFMHIPADSNTYDAAYAIEATCHAPDRVGVYSEIFRILKPGGVFASYEWVMTDDYDSKDPAHVAAKKGIERGNGLPDLESIQVVVSALKEAGFEVMEHFDLVPTSDIDWYFPLTPRLTPTGVFHTKLGRYIGLVGLKGLEYLKLAPAGSSATLEMLQGGGNALVEAAKLKIFTPMYWVHCRKPE